MTRVDSRCIAAGLVGVMLLAGCGSSSSGSGASSAPPSTTTTSPATGATPTAPGSASASPVSPSGPVGDITLKGTVRGDGLTCVSFVTDSGARYALGGPGLPSKLVDVAHSFGRRTSLKDQPSRGQIATVTLKGHVVTGAMSTCHLALFSVSSAQIQSIGPQ